MAWQLSVPARSNLSHRLGRPGGPLLWILTYQVDATGRAVVQQGTREWGILYVVSPTKVVMVTTGTAPVLDVFASAPSN